MYLAPALAAAAPQLPDLVADPPVGGNAPVVYGDGAGARLLLRMDGFVHNVGPGALEMRGKTPVNGVMSQVVQRVYDSNGGFVDRPSAASMIYETNDDHHHWHLRHAMRYSLWSDDRAREVAPAQKVGFCLLDSERIEAPASATATYTEPANDFCGSDKPATPSVFEGVSAGWRDIYYYTLAFQWVDISDVAPGRYWLRADADPDNVVAEVNEANTGSYSAQPSYVNGYRADPVGVGEVAPGQATPIELKATEFSDPTLLGEPGAREFAVTTPPAHGTLDVAPGTWFAGPTVRYTPADGYSGADTFSVAARDASSPFPRTPPTAAVTLKVAAAAGTQPTPEPEVLGISGAPKKVRAGTATQLTATGPGVEQGVEWHATIGTISAGGLYEAPKTVGTATITARSASGATGSVVIIVIKAPKSGPAPTPEFPPVPSRRRGLSRVKLLLHDDKLMAVATSALTGRVRFTGLDAGRSFGGCSLRVQRNGSATCRMRLPLASAPAARIAFLCRRSRTVETAPTGIAVRATLAHHGRIVARRRAALRPR